VRGRGITRSSESGEGFEVEKKRVDTPLLPDEPDQEPKLQPRYLPRPEVLRIIAATIALVGALIGLASRTSSTPSGLPYAPASGSTVDYFYGEIDARRHRVCADEIRPEPTHGTWTCRYWQRGLNKDFVGKRPLDRGGPCTHRTANQDQGVWECLTTVSIPAVALHMPYKIPVMFGDVRVANQTSSPGSLSVCTEEIRGAPTHGTWSCIGWKVAPAHFRFVQPVDPGGACTLRTADQQTGIWSCRSPRL
jgi:hypothetical protein